MPTVTRTRKKPLTKEIPTHQANVPTIVTLGRSCYELGFEAQYLLIYAESEWLCATPTSPFPNRTGQVVENIAAAASQLKECRPEMAAVAQQLIDAIYICVAVGKRHWLTKKHRRLIAEHQALEDSLCGEQEPRDRWWAQSTPLKAAHWRNFTQAVRAIRDTLPRSLANCLSMGAIVSDPDSIVVKSIAGTISSSSVFEKPWRVPECQQILVEMKVDFPELRSVDIELSDTVIQEPGVPYSACLRDKLEGLHETFLRGLVRYSGLENIDQRLDGTQEEPAPATKRRVSNDEANVVARSLLKENPKMSQRQLALKLGIAASRVGKLPAYRCVCEQLNKGKIPKRGPRTVRLTPAVHAHQGTFDDLQDGNRQDTDETLEVLIQEQKRDHEPSPLDNTGAVARHRKRL